MKNRKSRLCFTPASKPYLFRKYYPKYIPFCSIDNINSLNPSHDSTFTPNFFHSLKKAKVISQIQFSGNPLPQAIPFISYIIKQHQQHLNTFSGPTADKRKLKFLKCLRLKNLCIQLDYREDWSLLLRNRHLINLKIFLKPSAPFSDTLSLETSGEFKFKLGSGSQTLQTRMSQKIYQLLRHLKVLTKLKKVSLDGEYNTILLCVLEAFNIRLDYMLALKDIHLILSEKGVPTDIPQETQELPVWSIISDVLLKLSTSLNLSRNLMTFSNKFLNLRQLTISSLFVTDHDLLFFNNLRFIPCLQELDILLYGLNYTESLIKFLSLFKLPGSIQSFSLIVQNNISWNLDNWEHETNLKNSLIFDELVESWKSLKKLRKLLLRMNFIFKSSHIQFFGVLLQKLLALKELDLEIKNDNEIKNEEDAYSIQDSFDITEFVQTLSIFGVRLKKLNITSHQMLFNKLNGDSAHYLRDIKYIGLKNHVDCDKSFFQFMKLLPKELDRLSIDELVVEDDESLRYVFRALKCFTSVKVLKLMIYLGAGVNENKVVEGILKIINHFNNAEKFIVFINNYMLTNQSFMTIKEGILDNAARLSHVKGRVSDFNCNLCWSAKDRKVYYNQLDFFYEELY